MLVIEATHEWVMALEGIPGSTSAYELYAQSRFNNLSRYLSFFFTQYGIFYWNLRQQIRKEDVTAVQQAWKYSWSLFHTTKKKHYAKMSMISTYIEEFGHPAIKDILSKRLCNINGKYGRSIGVDKLTEKVSNSSNSREFCRPKSFISLSTH